MSNTYDQSPHFTIRGYWQTHGKLFRLLDNLHTTLDYQGSAPCSETKSQDRRYVPILTIDMLGFEVHKTILLRGVRVFNDEALMSFGQMISRRLKASAAQYSPLP
jgi:hypothetical protein